MSASVLALALASDAAAFPLLEPPEQVMGPIGRSLAVLDYDADGFVDVAGLGDAGVLTLRRGTPTGFAAPQTLPVPGSGYAPTLVAGDLTGDGRDDLVAVFGQSATVVLVRGRADGGLVEPQPGDVHAIGAPTVDRFTPTSVDVGDLDADGDLDVVAAMGVDEDSFTPPNTAENGHVTTLVNNGSGGLVAAPTTPAVNAPGDLLLLALAGDADLDLVVAQRNRPAATALKVFAGGPGVTFGPGTYVDAGAQATELDAGDFNGDARADLVVAHAGVGASAPQPATVLAGGAAPASLGAAVVVGAADGDHIVAGDLDRDGRDDLYVADGRPAFPNLPDSPDDAIFVRGLGGLQFGPRDGGTQADLPRSEASPQLADVDGDGKLDVVTSGWSGNVPPTHVFIRYGLGPRLVPTPEDTDFGSVSLGSRSAQSSVRFTNIGPGTATAVTREGTGDTGDFPIVGDGCSNATLAVDQSCTLDVAFAPTSLDDRVAAFGVFAPDADFVYPATLIGTGVPIPGPAASPVAQGQSQPPAPGTAPVRRKQRTAPSKPIVTPTTRRGLLRRGLRFTQRFPVAGSVRWTLARPGSSPATAFGRATRTLTRAGNVQVRIVLRGAGRRQFLRRRTTRLVLRTSFAPTGETRRSVTSAVVRLRR